MRKTKLREGDKGGQVLNLKGISFKFPMFLFSPLEVRKSYNTSKA